MARTVTLDDLRDQARQRADQEDSQFISDSELDGYLNASIAELWDLLVQNYGDSYYIAPPWTFSLAADTAVYALPPNLYKLIGVDAQLDSSQWYTLPRFQPGQRNRYQGFYPSPFPTPWAGLEYALWGGQIRFIPTPQGAVSARLWYVPAPDRLQQLTIGAIASNQITIAAHGLRDDQLVRPKPASSSATVPTGLRSDTDYYVIVVDKDTVSLSTTQSVDGTAGTAVTISAGTGTSYLWGVLDGVSGWEEYPVIDAAVKMGIKEESDVSGLLNQKQNMAERVRQMARNRDQGQAPRVIDVTGQYGQGGRYGEYL